MAYPIDHKTVLARTLLWREGIQSLVVIDRTKDRVEVGPFERETQATVFECAPVALLKREAITEFLLDDLDMFLDRENPLKFIHHYLKNADLYATEESKSSESVLLVLERGE